MVFIRIHLIQPVLRNLVQDCLMVPSVQVVVLFKFLKLLLAHISVDLFFVIGHELGEVSLAPVLNAQKVLVLKQNVDNMLSLFWVIAKDLDSLIVELVHMQSLEINFGHVQLIHNTNGKAVCWVAIVYPLLSNPYINDHVV